MSTTTTGSSNVGETQDDTHERKKTLRKSMRAVMKSIPNEEIEDQSQKVWETLMSLPEYRSAKAIGVFLSMPAGEIKTDTILLDAMAQGKDIYVPEVGKNFEQSDMEMRKVPQNPNLSPDEIFHKDWPRNKWKIPEPPDSMPLMTAKPGDIDLLVVPGLAFDRQANRLGHGAGYYDRFIARMIAGGDYPLHLVAVGLSPQMIEGDIPMTQNDQKMDMVLVPGELVKRR